MEGVCRVGKKSAGWQENLPPRTSEFWKNVETVLPYPVASACRPIDFWRQRLMMRRT